MWARQVRLLPVVALAMTLTGCAPLVGVTQLSSQEVNRSLTSNALSSGALSEVTRVALRRNDLIDRFAAAPEDALAELHRHVLAEDAANDDLFALAELSFFHATKTGKRSYYLAAAVYSFAFLFPDEVQHAALPTDPRYRWACDIYARAITAAFKKVNSVDMDAHAGRYELPFGTLDVAFDSADLQWGKRHLEDLLPVAGLGVRGLRNRYRSPGIGAPLAAATKLPPGIEAPNDLVGPFVRVPLTAVLLLEHPRGQLSGTELRATLRLFAATDFNTVKIGKQTVPLEIDRTAPIATTLAANGMLDSELTSFMGRAVGLTRQGKLGAREPYHRGRIPVVFVHGTNSSPGRWADMVNDLEADDWVRQRFQFWFFSYDSGAPIAYSSMLLRNSLRDAVKQFDPEGADECMKHMVIIGHSQGGLLAKMMVIHSGDRFWRNLSDTPIDELKIPETTRELVRSGMFIEPLPFVDRVIFISTPHRGSYLAGPEIVRRLMQRLVSMPNDLLRGGAGLFSNDDVKPYLKMQTFPTAIDNMSPSHPFIRAIEDIPVAPGIHAHSIISVEGNGPKQDGGDGVVKYVSAHIEPVDSERVVDSAHSCQSNPETIDEVQRILRLEASEISCGPQVPASEAGPGVGQP